MYKLSICLRYLRSHPIIYFSIGGVTIGIAVLIIVVSVMSGFSRDLRARIRGIQSHIVVFGRYSDVYIPYYEELIEKISRIKHVVACAPRVQYMAFIGRQGIIFGGPKGTVTFIGIDPRFEKGKLKGYFGRGGKRQFNFRYDSGEAPESPGAVLGSELFWVKGERFTLCTVRPRSGSFTYCEKEFEVVGSFKTGMSEYDGYLLFMPLEEAQRFLKLDQASLPKSAVTDIAITLDDYRYASEVRRKIEQIRLDRLDIPLGRIYRTQTWEEAKATLLKAVSIEKNVQIVILFFIIIVAGFNIVSIFTLLVRSKVKDIGILKALGATRGGISIIYLMTGFLCGTLGSLAGIFVGLLISYNLNSVADFMRQHFGIDPFPKDIYYLEAIPTQIEYPTIAVIVVSTMAVSLFSSIYPAIKASRYDPIQAIRYE
jgi:lipoprotein-releasing system permease protein